MQQLQNWKKPHEDRGIIHFGVRSTLVGYLQSSICHKVYKRRSSTKPDKLVASILEGFSNANKLKATDPRAHGHQMEDSARKTYVDHKWQSGSSVSVSEHGLFVDPSLPFLAASTDDLIADSGKSTGKGVLEIKCPACELSIEDLCSHRENFFLTSCDRSLWLKTSHSYYTQLQMEMALTQCEWADFVVYTSRIKEDIFVQRVDFDQTFWSKSLLA